MTLRCGILTLKTSDSFFRSFRFLRQNEAFSATEQNQTYNNSFSFRKSGTIRQKHTPFWRIPILHRSMRWRATTARQQRSVPFWQQEMSAAQWSSRQGRSAACPRRPTRSSWWLQPCSWAARWRNKRSRMPALLFRWEVCALLFRQTHSETFTMIFPSDIIK